AATATPRTARRRSARPGGAAAVPTHHAPVVTAIDTAALGWHQTTPATVAPTPAPARTGSRPSASTPATAPGTSDSETALARMPPSCMRWNAGRYSPAITSDATP